MIKEFTIYSWIFVGFLIAIGFMVTFMTVVFLVCEWIYYMQVKHYLLIDTFLATIDWIQ